MNTLQNSQIEKRVMAPGIKRGELPGQLRTVGGLRRIELEEYEPGIYFLCLLGEVVYVGQTSRPKMRISAHIQEKQKIFDRAFFRHCRLEELNTLESFFIHALEPKYNCTLPNGQKLAPQTMQDIAATARWLVGRDIKKRVHIEALK